MVVMMMMLLASNLCISFSLWTFVFSPMIKLNFTSSITMFLFDFSSENCLQLIRRHNICVHLFSLFLSPLVGVAVVFCLILLLKLKSIHYFEWSVSRISDSYDFFLEISRSISIRQQLNQLKRAIVLQMVLQRWHRWYELFISKQPKSNIAIFRTIRLLVSTYIRCRGWFWIAFQ